MDLGPWLLRAIKRRVFPLKTHFWEYYGRMTFASEFLQREGGREVRVLDVGGAPGDNLLKKFGIPDVTTLDLDERSDIVASADHMPLADDSYDFVTCLDTLEHMPRPMRPRAIAEMVRVARRGLAVVAPQDTAENRKAEELVLRYVPDPFVTEHRASGLWDSAETERQLERLRENGQIARFERHELDNLLLWVCLMVEDYANLSEIYEQASFLENRFHARRVGLLVWK
jgi:hypothetical protein